MFCCSELSRLADHDLLRLGPPHTLPSGRIFTEIQTDHFLVFGDERPTYVGLHYCPFCGRALSHDIWNREKKK